LIVGKYVHQAGLFAMIERRIDALSFGWRLMLPDSALPNEDADLHELLGTATKAGMSKQLDGKDALVCFDEDVLGARSSDGATALVITIVSGTAKVVDHRRDHDGKVSAMQLAQGDVLIAHDGIGVTLEGDPQDLQVQVAAFYEQEPIPIDEADSDTSESESGSDSDYGSDFYGDEDDRADLDSMPDMERELILTERRERRERKTQRRKMHELVSQSDASEADDGKKTKKRGKGKRKAKKTRARRTRRKVSAATYELTGGVLVMKAASSTDDDLAVIYCQRGAQKAVEVSRHAHTTHA
jgi:hypothetical protein